MYASQYDACIFDPEATWIIRDNDISGWTAGIEINTTSGNHTGYTQGGNRMGSLSTIHAMSGTKQLSGTSEVSVTCNGVRTSNGMRSIIVIEMETPDAQGDIGVAYVSSRTDAASFGLKSTLTGDTSTYRWRVEN